MSLRTRLLLSLVGTSAITLLALALALLPPLQSRLRDEARDALEQTVLASRESLEGGHRPGHRRRRVGILDDGRQRAVEVERHQGVRGVGVERLEQRGPIHDGSLSGSWWRP